MTTRSNSDATSATSQPPAALRLVAATPLATQILAHYFASSLHPGDSYLLRGQVGAGKSYFSRAFVRAALHDAEAPVPSPTFLLQNIYPANDLPIHHLDLYRLEKAEELSRLDLETSLPNVVSLIEWPERLGRLSPPVHLGVHIAALTEHEQKALESKLDNKLGRNLENSDDDADEEQEDDVRWRRVELQPHGEWWEERVQSLREHVAARGEEFGLLLLE